MQQVSRIGIFAPALLLAVAQAAPQRLLDETKTAEECLLLDADRVAGISNLYEQTGGGWVDDGDRLYEQWQPGMGVRAVTYCVNEEFDQDQFMSLQIVVGDENNWIPLMKHGSDGGSCYDWVLETDDYIREIQYTWSRLTFQVTGVVFVSNNNQKRKVGHGIGSNVVSFEYSMFQPFVGLFTYEYEDRTLAIGAYEDDCHNAPKKNPFNLDFMLPSTEEVSGEAAVASMTWINEDHGESALDVEMLDQIEQIQKEEDEQVAEPDSAVDHIINVDFEVNVEVVTPPSESNTEIIIIEPPQPEPTEVLVIEEVVVPTSTDGQINAWTQEQIENAPPLLEPVVPEPPEVVEPAITQPIVVIEPVPELPVAPIVTPVVEPAPLPEAQPETKPLPPPQEEKLFEEVFQPQENQPATSEELVPEVAILVEPEPAILIAPPKPTDTREPTVEVLPSSSQVVKVQPSEEVIKIEVSEATKNLEFQLAEMRAELIAKEAILEEQITAERVTENEVAKTEEQSDTAWLLLVVMAILLFALTLVVIVLCCMVSNQKRLRANEAIIREQTLFRDQEANPRELRDPYGMNAGPVEKTAIVGSHSLRQHQSITPLTVEAPDEFKGRQNTLGDTSNTMMMGAMQTPIGTFNTNQTDKQNNADAIAKPEQVQLEFAMDQPQAYGSAGQNPLGNNPFESGNTDRDNQSEDNGDLNLTEESVRGITPRVPQQQQVASMPVTPNGI